eukprot:TRINITY_DN687_c0_g1_i4.p1 TRINITY_DN687_c0_g1~~TRINITY_DN687_c0_g1_i4.p1  ORF type:complete len:238 (+),score=31.90 TRINITY_DN687_c0_g1_i4:169-882(+)
MRVILLFSLLFVVAMCGFDPNACTYVSSNGYKYDLAALKTDLEYYDQEKDHDYWMHVCGKLSHGDCSADSMICQIAGAESKSCGILSSLAGSDSSDGGDKGVTLAINGGTEGCETGLYRSSTIYLSCGTTTTVYDFHEDTCHYNFWVRSPAGCPASKGKSDSKSKKGLSGGSVILIILLVCTVLYIGCGIGYNYKFAGKRGAEMLPNLQFWKDLPALCRDGFLFAIHGFKKDNYTQV